ncbi:MAG: sugar phosphate isomerase/epimerase [Spirochaetes bacterium]|nr:sugar phosphate isomerase/epimerase [Spirochaetota bacterium]
MQGRLLPKYRGRFQAHPVGYWEDEFPLAAACGLSLIEFILDYHDADKNPLLEAGGVGRIRKASAATGVGVETVCADYFMEAPLHHADPGVRRESAAVFRRLLDTAGELGVGNLVLPCVDQSSLGGTEAADRLVESLAPLLPLAAEKGVFISFETDLAPAPFAALLARIDHPAARVNWDTGNSASLGYDAREEWRAYGPLISDVHLKDRVRGGGSILLGDGAVDWEACRTLLKDYAGPVILQAWRDDEGLGVFKRQLAWVRGKFGGIVP